ncbi:MAG: hypothetical protein O3A20_03205 [Planctomycetota bacterium]|nr:hypothetical protein [Planctomycetota bacterium]
MSLILITVVATGAAPLSAQDPAPDAAELARRLELLAAEVQELRGGAPAGPALDSGGLGPAASTVYRASPGRLSWASYGEVTYKRPDATTDGGTPSGLGDSWDLHRAVLYLGYRFDERWLFNAEIEFEHGDEVGIEFAYLEARLNDAVGVRAGHLLTPLGLVNEIHEPTTFYSAQRPLVETFVIPSTWHENGVGVVADWRGFSGRAYVMNGFDASGFDLSKDGLRGGRQGGSKASAEDLALAARLDWEGIPGLLLGVGAFSGDSGQNAGASDFATSLMEAHAQWQWRALRLRGLWAQGSVDDAALLATPAPGEDLEGWYLEAGWDLLAGAGAQALTPFLRWEEFDLSADAPGDSGVRALSLGISWQPTPQIVFKADYTDLRNDADSVADTFAFTAGWAF